MTCAGAKRISGDFGTGSGVSRKLRASRSPGNSICAGRMGAMTGCALGAGGKRGGSAASVLVVATTGGGAGGTAVTPAGATPVTGGVRRPWGCARRATSFHTYQPQAPRTTMTTATTGNNQLRDGPSAAAAEGFAAATTRAD